MEQEPPSRATIRGSIYRAGSTQVVCSLPLYVVTALAAQLRTDLDLSAAQLGLLVSWYHLARSLISGRLGRLVDRIGARSGLVAASVFPLAAGLLLVFVGPSLLSLGAYLTLAALGHALVQPAANRMLLLSIGGTGPLATAFGIKQSAPPIASFVAGALVPTLALVVAWSAPFAMLAVLGALTVVLGLRGAHIGRRSTVTVNRRPPAPPADASSRKSLRSFAWAFGLSLAASSAVTGFFVDASVVGGVSQQRAGWFLGLASLGTVCARLAAGVVCDRFAIDPLRLSSGFLIVGAAGCLLLASGVPALLAVGVVSALVGTWGHNGVFWYALVRAHGDAPGRATGAMGPALVGGIIWPFGFGVIADAGGYGLAWGATALVSAFAVVAMMQARRHLVPQRDAAGLA